MTVSELIEELKKFPGHLPVRLDTKRDLEDAHRVELYDLEARVTVDIVPVNA